MSANLLDRVLLGIPNEPRLIPASTRFTQPEGVWLPETWMTILSMSALSAKALLDIWQPLIRHLPNAIEIIAKHTLQVALAIYPDREKKVSLMYIFRIPLEEGQTITTDEQDVILAWSAGRPATNKDIADAETRLDIPLPRSYKDFVRMHNGFTVYPLDVGPRPLGNLFFISEYQDWEPDPDYRSNRLLAFSGDGAGNQRCYNLMAPLPNEDFLTYDWDHETYQVTRPQGFWEYIEQLVTREMADAQTREI